MRLKKAAFIIFISALVFTACSKKTQPTSAVVNKPVVTKTTAPVAKKKKIPTPKIITVDDRAATRAPDGRLYYDFDGKRYWKNFDDGKYYLFAKAMYADPAFKPH